MPYERPLEPLIVPTTGETIFVAAGSRVRYSKPFEEGTVYWAICMPAFSPDFVHREDDYAAPPPHAPAPTSRPS